MATGDETPSERAAAIVAAAIDGARATSPNRA
jgi:hypothetical protein